MVIELCARLQLLGQDQGALVLLRAHPVPYQRGASCRLAVADLQPHVCFG